MAPPSYPTARPSFLHAAALAVVLALAAAACADQPAGAPDTTTDPAADPAASTPTGSPAAPATTPGGEAAPGEPLERNLAGCADAHTEGTDYFPEQVTFSESTGVTVRYHDTHKVVEVTPPNLPDSEPVRYVLVQCGVPAPELDGDLAGAQVIEVPVREVVTLTTTNLPHFAELEAVDRLVGVGTAGYVTTPEVVERIEAGAIGEFADAGGQPDLERLVAAEPDLLVMDGFGDTILDDVGRVSDAGIPAVIIADFNEQTALGRTEWLKFTALFLNAEGRAQAAYDAIAGRYAERRESATHYDERPRVLVNTPYEGTWFVPGGESYVANLIADAGGEYVFADDDSAGSLSLDIETVIDAGADADVWIQAGSVDGTLDDLLATDERFASFDAFQAGEVWAWDRWTTAGGGNALFEVAYTRTDLLLDDLVAILHPEARADIDLTFYGQVTQ